MSYIQSSSRDASELDAASSNTSTTSSTSTGRRLPNTAHTWFVGLPPLHFPNPGVREYHPRNIFGIPYSIYAVAVWQLFVGRRTRHICNFAIKIEPICQIQCPHDCTVVSILPLLSNEHALKSRTFGVPGLVLLGRGTTWHKSGTSREIRDGWQPYGFVRAGCSSWRPDNSVKAPKILMGTRDVVYWLLTENYVLNANILVFMLIHTELFSNVSGLGLLHCGLGLEKKFWASVSSTASLFLASALASCPAGLVNIPDGNTHAQIYP